MPTTTTELQLICGLVRSVCIVCAIYFNAQGFFGNPLYDDDVGMR